jgi:hypothetical protein
VITIVIDMAIIIATELSVALVATLNVESTSIYTLFLFLV